MWQITEIFIRKIWNYVVWEAQYSLLGIKLNLSKQLNSKKICLLLNFFLILCEYFKKAC